MSLVETEQVLVVPTALFHEIGHFQGFTTEVDRYLKPLLGAPQVSYRPRGEMEEDPSFKQFIPYVIFTYDNPASGLHVFSYTRGSGHGEKRLHSKMSVGVGGHISSEDHAVAADNPYAEGMRRELEEEIIIDTPYQECLVGMINDDETDVGKVHLGVVHLFKVELPNVRSREDDLLDAEFRPIGELRGRLDRMESWSRFALEALFQREE